MIYAIRAVGTEFIKFGRAEDVQERLRQHQCSNPHKLELIVAGDWPDEEERKILDYLNPVRVRGEWFKTCQGTRLICRLLAQPLGLQMWRGMQPPAYDLVTGLPKRLRRAAKWQANQECTNAPTCEPTQ